MKYIVYCTTCLVNGKIYIGVHKTENPDVFDGYYGNGVEKGWLLKNPKTAFQRALKKYGYNSFKRAVLYVFDNEDDAYKKEEEIVTLDFIKRKDNYNTSPGGRHQVTYKWIYRYHLDGSFWEEHCGVQLLAEKMGISPVSLREACMKKRSYKNSFWSFEKVAKLPMEEYKLNKFSPIYQFDAEGNLLKTWECLVKDICSELDITEANLLSGLNKKTMVKTWYFLKDKDKIFDILKSKKSIPNVAPGTAVQMEQYDLEGNLIKV